MPETNLLKHVFQAQNYAVAVADPESWAVIFENGRFFQWFPPNGETAEGTQDTLKTRLLGLDLERALARLGNGRPYAYDAEVKAGPRTLSLAVTLRGETVDGRDYLVVECQNVSKQKEAEYMLDSYSRLAERNTRELQREKERVEKLLLNLMPRSVYEELKDLGTTTPQRFDSASVLMLDFVGFTDMAISREPGALISELNDIFTGFDRIVELFGCERIKTIGDAYLAVSGIPEATTDHAANAARVALRMRRYLERRNAAHPTEWRCRIGIHTGPVIGSIVGIQKYVYDIFGPAVNLASRLETRCEPMQILVSEETYGLLRDDFRLADRGEIEIRGFGLQQVYSLEGEMPK